MQCDEQQPQCGACVKRGSKCVYRKDINFVFFQPRSSESPEPVVGDRGTETTANPVSRASSTPSWRLSPFDLPPSALLTARSVQAHGYFLSGYLPKSARSTELQSSLGLAAPSLWITTAADLALRDPLLNDALLALSLKYAEGIRSHQLAQQHSHLFHSRVTRNLARRLSNKNDYLQDSTLAAVMALIAWEVS